MALLLQKLYKRSIQTNLYASSDIQNSNFDIRTILRFSSASWLIWSCPNYFGLS